MRVAEVIEMTGGVKGTAISSVIEDVQRLVSQGRISRAELEVRLEPRDVELLEEKVLPSNWYSLESYGRLSRVLFEVEGRSAVEYLVERGRRAAERLRSAGLYAQLAVDRERWGERLGQMMIPLGPAIYRDTVWRIEQRSVEGAVHFAIEVDVPVHFPDLCRHQTEGFIEHAASHAAGQRIEVSSERLAPTRIVFRGRPRP
jgi:hypothetical protein